VVFGLGFGMVNAPITNAAVSGMPRSQAGVAAAVASTSRQLGQSLGVAVVGALAAVGVASPQANVADSRIGWILTAGCGLVILVVGLVSSSAWARRTAERTAVEVREIEQQPLPAAA
jgi:apolipoprotein N-acyltransferase